jgi:hypothetical protein
MDDGVSEEGCPHMSTCEMYKIFRHAGVLSAWKALYCTGEFKNCARYEKVSLGHPVPPNLMPNGTLLHGKKK